MRLDKERQYKLEPERIAYAKKCITDLGFEITKDILIENKTFFEFIYKGNL